MPRHKMTTIEAHVKGRHPTYAPRKTCPLCAERAVAFKQWQDAAIATNTICRSCMSRYTVPSLGMCETCRSS